MYIVDGINVVQADAEFRLHLASVSVKLKGVNSSDGFPAHSSPDRCPRLTEKDRESLTVPKATQGPVYLYVILSFLGQLVHVPALREEERV